MKNKTHYEIFCLCGANLSDIYLDVFCKSLRKKDDKATVKCLRCDSEILVTRLGGGLGYRIRKHRLDLKRG